MTSAPKKKLIETSLPLEAINEHSAREKSVRQGHPSTLHLWWSRKPLATARGILFAQLVDDPSARPEEFATIGEQDAERIRLHTLMERLIQWENSTDENLMEQARAEIRKSNHGELPVVLDPFAGGGSIPLEAQRLGLKAHASDLNPLSVLINKALIEIPPKFTGFPPVFPGAAGSRTGWNRAEGLAEDVRRYGEWMRDEAQARIGHLYPKATVPGGTEHSVIAWLWARTVKSPNPANPIEVPLVNSWWLGKKKGKEAWVHASVVNGEVRYAVRHDAEGPQGDADGTVSRKGGVSIADGTPIDFNYIRAEGRAGRIGAHLIALVGEGKRGRLYVSPTAEHVAAANVQRPLDIPEGDIPENPRNFNTPNYGLKKFSDLFTNRQLVALTTLGDLVAEARKKALEDALAVGLSSGKRLENGGTGAEAYADAVATYLALSISRTTDRHSAISTWDNSTSKEQIRGVFARQAIPMTWGYAEGNPFVKSSGSLLESFEFVAKALDHLPSNVAGEAEQKNAEDAPFPGVVISTDPPYYDMIGYSDLSDYFYVWIRRTLREIQSKTVGTMLTPKAEELVANPYRHEGKAGAEKFFVDGFNSVFAKFRESASLTVPMTVYYAYKQQDTRDAGAASTGWHTLLSGLINSGWEVTATWPIRSELSNRMLASGTNALASSIVLACRPRPTDAPATTRRAFVGALKSELPDALRTLMQGMVAPVDLAQAAIGPGIAVFSRYSRVRDADGSDMTVKDALRLVNATLDEVIGEQESDFDADTRFAIKWYRQYGWTQESSGIADQLARSSDTSIGALQRGGIFEAKGGKARLISPSQLDGEWHAASDGPISVWEVTVRLAAAMANNGADKVAELLPAVQTRVNLDAVKELGFLLFHEAEKKKNTKDAVLFNGLVSAWGDVTEQAREYEPASRRGAQQAFDFNDMEN